MKKIVLLSSGQPSANPRLVKEAIALHAAGYAITVVYCPLSPWADAFDADLFARHPDIQWVKAGYHPLQQKRHYQMARMRRKFYHLLFRTAGNIFDAAVRSFAFYSQELTSTACKYKADLYIGHNIGALPSVVHAARKHAAKAAFDFEDFHRGEEQPGSLHWQKVEAIENKYVQKLQHATAASPLITQAYKELYPGIRIHTVNNCFSLSYGAGEVKPLPNRPLKLFWFSQYIGAKRGLETVIAAMGKIKNPTVQLSLLGNSNNERRQYFLNLAAEHQLAPEQLVFLDPVPEHAIAGIAAQHQVGLAVEVPHILNREICLTNKLFMYLLAGNAIIFSHTKAQAGFLSAYPGTGEMYEQADVDGLAALLQNYLGQPALLESHRQRSLALGISVLNWEQEQQVLCSIVQETLTAQ